MFINKPTMMFKTSIAIIMLGLSSSVFAVGVPVINLGEPIKISESKIYSCDENGNALDTGNPMRYKDKSVICRNDNLWADGKALNFFDLTEDFLSNSKTFTEAVKYEVFNVNRVDDEKQMVLFTDKKCKYTGESSEVKSGQWIIKVKERICQDFVEKVNMFAYPEVRIIAPIPAGSAWILTDIPIQNN